MSFFHCVIFPRINGKLVQIYVKKLHWFAVYSWWLGFKGTKIIFKCSTISCAFSQVTTSIYFPMIRCNNPYTHVYLIKCYYCLQKYCVLYINKQYLLVNKQKISPLAGIICYTMKPIQIQYLQYFFLHLRGSNGYCVCEISLHAPLC